ncbi:CLUMA_CG012036, isoform A [Clunio marinus]|uniref:CLUMA_CG012036, isoform A n=1 Tax=Clunio marinus TaxID=568069 RepID=A0A1J1IGC0_9DIPT|nr:CLUMA_CG012036, isoform A [Clunio marinus]
MKTCNMMIRLMISALSFLIISPAISMCDEDLKSLDNLQEKNEQVPTNLPEFTESIEQLMDAHSDEDQLNDPWMFYRQIRAPSGFFGVRGKKEDEQMNFWELGSQNELLPLEVKRQPSQSFFGMRGKKYYDMKRAPSGFMGVRGKKNDYNYKAPNDFQDELYKELQLEREMLTNLIEDYEDEINDQGLRNKKSVSNDDYFEYEKRAPMGFQGVRGKKSEFTDFISPNEKRVPFSGFFGTRGKKHPLGFHSSNIFGVRKKPYMPYTKFVGVRGKKSVDGNVRKLRLDTNAMYGLRPSHRVGSDMLQDKTIGFIGMRG